MLAIMHKETLAYLTIPREQRMTLTFRVVQGMFNMFCTYYVIKYFPLVYVTLVANTAPLLIALFAFLFYSEKLTRLDVGILIASFFGVSVLITGSVEGENKQLGTLDTTIALVVAIFLLIMIPFN